MNIARQNDTCDQCGRKPTLSRRKDGTGWRALYWCFACSKAAFGGDSFVRVAPDHLDMLPAVAADNDRQGRLW